MMTTWDCEYGNYADMNNEVEWYDDFYPRTKECDGAIEYYDEMVRDLLEDIATHFFGLKTDEWSDNDYDIFVEKVGL